MTRMSARAALGWFAALAALAGGCALDHEEEPPVPPDYRSSWYRIDRIDLPKGADEADAAALDLDGDDTPDNVGGNALASFQAVIETAGERLPVSVDEGLAGGRVDWIIEVGRDIVLPGRAAAALHSGSDDDGDGRYQMVDGIELVGDGSQDGDLVRTSGGDGRIPASFLADVNGDWPVTWVNGFAVGLVMRERSAGELEGRIGFATRGDFGPVIAGPLAEFMTERLQAGTLVYAADMDADQDGIISEEEFLADPLTQILLNPDLDLDDDGAIESMSAGFRVHATEVVLE
jgi:hypothetical protein